MVRINRYANPFCIVKNVGLYFNYSYFQQPFLCVIISNTIISISFIACFPKLVRLRIDWSISLSIIPSASVTCWLDIESIAESTAVDTPDDTFKAQLGFAPSQTIPVRLAIIFFIEQQILLQSPPIKQVMPQLEPVQATIQPQSADSVPRFCLI